MFGVKIPIFFEFQLQTIKNKRKNDIYRVEAMDAKKMYFDFLKYIEMKSNLSNNLIYFRYMSVSEINTSIPNICNIYICLIFNFVVFMV